MMIAQGTLSDNSKNSGSDSVRNFPTVWVALTFHHGEEPDDFLRRQELDLLRAFRPVHRCSRSRLPRSLVREKREGEARLECCARRRRDSGETRSLFPFPARR